MGILQALSDVLHAFKPRTLGAVIVLLATLLGTTFGVFGTLGAQWWWVTTRGREYAESEAARYGAVVDRQDKFDRRLKALEEDRDLDRKTADRVTRIEGMVELLVDRSRRYR